MGKARERCWKYDWVIDLDIRSFFDNLPHDPLMKLVRKHLKCKWALRYIERWLVAPMQREDGAIEPRTIGVPQGSVLGQVLSNLYLHYAMDEWLRRNYPGCPFERFMDDSVIHCGTEAEAVKVKDALEAKLKECGLEMHAVKTITVEETTFTDSSTSSAIRSSQGRLGTVSGKCGSRTVCRQSVTGRCDRCVNLTSWSLRTKG